VAAEMVAEICDSSLMGASKADIYKTMPDHGKTSKHRALRQAASRSPRKA